MNKSHNCICGVNTPLTPKVLRYSGGQKGPRRPLGGSPRGQSTAAAKLQVSLRLRGSGPRFPLEFCHLFYLKRWLLYFWFVAVQHFDFNCFANSDAGKLKGKFCRRTLSWEPWRWGRIYVFLQRCGSPAPFLRARRRPEWTTSLKSWASPRWPTPRCIRTRRRGNVSCCLTQIETGRRDKGEMNAAYNHQNDNQRNKGWPGWMLCLRWALRWPGGSPEERGRGRASAWSWSSTPRCSFWMNRPRAWMPAPPTPSCYYWKGRKDTSHPLMLSTLKSKAFLWKDHLCRLALEESVRALTAYFRAKVHIKYRLWTWLGLQL